MDLSQAIWPPEHGMRGSLQPWLAFVVVAFLPWTRCETTVLVEPAATKFLHVTGNTDVFQAVWIGS